MTTPTDLATRWTDHHGHSWPITGHQCPRCGLPLIRAEPDQTTHPNCDERNQQ